MKKVIDFIVNKRLIFIIVFSLMALVSMYLMTKVNINNDVSSYLDPKSDTKVTLELMQDEFGSSNQYSLMLEDISLDDSILYQKKISEVDGVTSVLFDEENNYKDNNALYTIYLKDEAYSDSAKKCVNEINELVSSYPHYAMGTTVEMQFLGDAVTHNMVTILLWAIAVVLLIIILNSKSWIEPLVFIIVIFVSIIINLGTNAFFDSVSFVTESICAIMQLALAMDYSIMFLHTYMSVKEENNEMDAKDIVKITLRRVFLPILGSSFTTIAGLLALVTMRFKLGVDIGVVLAKGISISLIITLLFMPGIIILFSKLIDKTKHRNLYTVLLDKLPSIKDRIANFQYKTRFIIPSILVIIIVIGAIFNFKAKFAYTLETSSNPNSSINISINKIESTFGIQNTVCVLIPKDDNKEDEILELIKNYKYNDKYAFNNFISCNTLHYYDQLTKEELINLFNLPSFLIDGIYQNDEEEIMLKDIVNYLETSSYIDDIFKSFNDYLLMLDELLDHQDETLDSTVFCDLLNKMVNNDIYNNTRAENILIDIYGDNYHDHTFKELYYYLINNNYLYNNFMNLKNYDNYYNELDKEYSLIDLINLFGIKDDINELYNIYDHNLRSLIKMIIDHNINCDNDIYNDYLNVYNTCDIILNKNEALASSINNLYIYPESAFNIIYLFSDTKSMHELIHLLDSLINTSANLEKANMANFQPLIKYLDEEITVDEIANLTNLDKDLINDYLAEFNLKLGKLDQIIDQIIDNNILNDLHDNIKNTMMNKFSLLHYAISQVEGKNYNRIVANMNYDKTSDEQGLILRDIKNQIKQNYNNTYIVSEGSAYLDFEDTFSFDSILINILSFVFILIIIAVSFKSILIPILLTFLIEGAIWVTLGLSVISKHNEYFICYLMVVCIQMGTTIDYGILLTSNYLAKRKELDKLPALKEAFFTSLPTILTSGIIIIIASFIVGIVSEVSIISSIGYLLSKGTIISVLFIIFSLPQILLIFDKLIIRKKKE